ncbi:hypothetical protein G6M78_15425 [Agrobacterium tumefaciens]|uniref:hypothetical protein n=1 Tax=Agrobacterium tumefaciens TaxID=358 RepID=UPI00157416F7|nr:hypothetical protein [Agrobacterium tumefaciens]MCZ7497250.1 hypothetical protein [Rhizobium rhizogenes]NTE56467.1 hypothetical protein [Agrobacterium tumefaciens]NTE74435.1 hypothetical protein [Agrobacterium tumefaciens]
MTNALEINIEELRRELGHCDPAERALIEAELEQAYAELQIALAEQEGGVGRKPPS